MRAEYRLPVKSELKITIYEPASVYIDNSQVDWESSENSNYLQSVIIKIPNLQIKHCDDGLIMTVYPELYEQAFKIALYVANRILIQTSVDAIDPEMVLHGSPQVFPETPEEEKEFKNSLVKVSKGFSYSWSIMGKFQPSCYSAGVEHFAAFALFADALRAASPFQKFKQFYEVVEYFFPPEKEQTESISEHGSKYDKRFTLKKVIELRDIRQRCTHPHRKNHLHPGELILIREVKEKLIEMQGLAELLLNYPP
ncbi:MAG: hypothetical protein HY034_02050 [Nitrospirae bacterium]|nr:hypothetical protein [Nitrospirota bacterium]